MQQTFDLPPLKEDHAYRIVMGGANCDRSGEGYQIYVNGKLLKEAKGGYFRTPGLRGAYLFKDALPEFKGGKVTIAVRSHLRYTHFRDGRVYFGDHPAYVGKTVPPNGHVSLWIEESRIPQPVLGAASQKQ